MNEHLKENYAYHRARWLRASVALELAREDLASGKRLNGRATRMPIYGPINVAYGERHARWVENANYGLRLVDYADRILPRSIEHTGWYTEDDGLNDETLRGIVYQLPTRKHRERFAYGYADPNNDGAAFLSFDPCDSKEDAARWADQLAERVAESERDYNRAWQAGRKYEDLGDTIEKLRADARALVREMKAARLAKLTGWPRICAALQSTLQDLRDQSRKAFERREQLLSDYGHEAGFEDA